MLLMSRMMRSQVFDIEKTDIELILISWLKMWDDRKKELKLCYLDWARKEMCLNNLLMSILRWFLILLTQTIRFLLEFSMRDRSISLLTSLMYLPLLTSWSQTGTLLQFRMELQVMFIWCVLSNHLKTCLTSESLKASPWTSTLASNLTQSSVQILMTVKTSIMNGDINSDLEKSMNLTLDGQPTQARSLSAEMSSRWLLRRMTCPSGSMTLIWELHSLIPDWTTDPVDPIYGWEQKETV